MTALLTNQLTDTEAWRSQALCANVTSDLGHVFFSEELTDIATAKRICAGCPVMAECLQGALERHEPYGVWGGQLFSQGKVLTIKRRRGRPPKVARPEDDFPQIPVPDHLVALLQTA